LPHQVGAEVTPDHVSTHGQRQSCFLMPPFTQINDLVQTQRLIEKLPFVDQQSGVAITPLHCFNDAIEWHYFIFEIGVKNAQGQEGTGERARYSNLQTGQVRLRELLARYHNRSVVVSDRCSVREQNVLVRNVGIGMKTNCSDVVSASDGLLV